MSHTDNSRADALTGPIPCHFCGSDDLFLDDALGKRAVICNNCEANGPTGEDDADAIRAWNARAPVEQHEAAPAEPEPPLSVGDRLTRKKAAHIIARDGFYATGYVLGGGMADGRRCIVEMGAVRWLTTDEAWRLMHPDEQPAPSAPLEGTGNGADERAAFDAWFADAWNAYPDKETTSEIKSKVWALKAWRHLPPRAAASQPAAAAGQEVEPVCWITKEQLEQLKDLTSDAWVYWRETGHVAEDDELALYTAPPAQVATRQELTDRGSHVEWHMVSGDWKEELVALHGPRGHIVSGLTVEQARAIIDAHGGCGKSANLPASALLEGAKLPNHGEQP